MTSGVQSRFPTTAMREEVGRAIGLSARKVQVCSNHPPMSDIILTRIAQVWFQASHTHFV